MGIKWEQARDLKWWAWWGNHRIAVLKASQGFWSLRSPLLEMDSEYFEDEVRNLGDLEGAKAWFEQFVAQWLEERGLAFAIPWRHVDDELPLSMRDRVVICDPDDNAIERDSWSEYNFDENGDGANVAVQMWDGDSRSGPRPLSDYPYWCYPSEIPLPAPRAEAADE